MRTSPAAGEIYKHFKGKLYQIQCVATHSETGERLVIYQAMYGGFGYFARPLSMFLSPVDHEKYPDCRQKYRFERVEKEEISEQEEVPSRSLLMEFLEADDIKQQRDILIGKQDEFTQVELDTICEILGFSGIKGSLFEQILALDQFLSTKAQYEGHRLRGK